MKFTISVITFLAIFYSGNAAVDEDTLFQNQGFENFLRLIMEDYPIWLRDNNLDPVPPVAGPADISATNALVDLACEISNYYVSGLTKELYVRYISVDLMSGNFDVEVSFIHNITFGGQYVANGSVLGSIPLQGEGDWRIVTTQMDQRASFGGFKITPDGYVDIVQSTYKTAYASMYDLIEFHFEGLLDNGAGGFEESVQDTVMGSFRRFTESDPLESSDGYPAANHLYTYLQEVFAATPLSEIIGTTPRPTTDPPEPTTSEWTEPPTEHSSTTTPPPPSTCPPCFCQQCPVVTAREELVLDEVAIQFLEKYFGRRFSKNEKLAFIIA